MYKDKAKERETTRKRVAKWREKQKTLQNTIKVTPVTDSDIENLPEEAKAELKRITEIRKSFGLVDNLRERQEMAVRRIRGY